MAKKQTTPTRVILEPYKVKDTEDVRFFVCCQEFRTEKPNTGGEVTWHNAVVLDLDAKKAKEFFQFMNNVWGV